jgi:hypothetical protein
LTTSPRATARDCAQRAHHGRADPLGHARTNSEQRFANSEVQIVNRARESVAASDEKL